MLHGFIKIHRSIMDWEWYKDNDTKSIFIHLMLKANFKATKWRGINLEEGQVIVSQENLARDLNITRQKVRTALKRLEKSGNIIIKSTNKYTLITIVNWAKYQTSERDINQQITNE